ncbi:MAG: exonuclease SbcCD subunit D C-terminal domain-containing protein [Desulfobacteraceae bacterium]|nr:exonuclease SbcCD subunit D C-terminal domain-containing protein [Desulfobacteraceae bacterium]
MKFLHTSDWHIGRSLYGRKRYDEFSAFLDWLAGFIEAREMDALLVAGDVFDTGTPSNRSQELYYGFLRRVSASCCRHVVIIAGNHDSPSFLNAPKEILKALQVHVVGAFTGNPEEEVLVLKGPSGNPEAVVCAVPYLRDRDIRVAEAGESLEDKNMRLIQGIKTHYAEIAGLAEEKRKICGDIPVVALGHLFAAGGKTLEGDGVRELYVGSLARVGKEVFPPAFDYVALGHLHLAQTVGGDPRIRYSGSPIPMGFGEAGREKKVIRVEFQGRIPEISDDPIPCFQALERISGDMEKILGRLFELKALGSRAWLEIEYTGQDLIPDLRLRMEEAVAGTGMEIRRIRNRQVMDRILRRKEAEEELDNLSVTDVFDRLLDAHGVDPEKRPALVLAHQEILTLLHEQDTHAE